MTNQIEYVIYCRKSTDDSSWMQTQSIPDQIKKCIKYAKDNKLKIMDKPKDFSDFESEREVLKEDNETDIDNRRMYQDTRQYYIIKESKTWKIPWARTKRGKLIKLIKKGKIKWLISYSPDRQARNILEWGELINLVDDWLIDLKYTNFHFEDNASWKMMLGIWFVFSKQYADKLSEDIWRWNKSKVEKGKALGVYKYGYYRDDEDGYYKPHPEYFDLMLEAFRLKLYKRKSDVFIAGWLNSNGFEREYKNKDSTLVSDKRLGEIWNDEFYYWIFISGWNTVDLREEWTNPFYKPLINEDEHVILRERSKKHKEQYTEQRRKEKFEEVTPLRNKMVITQDWYSMSHNVPNRKRFIKRLQKLKKTNPKATLKDVVEPKHIHYKCSSKYSKYQNLDITFDIIDKAIHKLLSKIHIDDEKYEEYLRFLWDELENIVEDNKTKASKIQVQINRIKSQRTKFLKRNLWKKMDKEEQEVYSNEKKRFSKELELLEKERQWLDTYERNTILEFEVLVQILQKAPQYYKKATYVQKRKIMEIFVSNIVITARKAVKIKVNPIMGSLFSWVVDITATVSNTLYEFVSYSKLTKAKQMIQRYIVLTGDRQKVLNKLTPQQRELYQLSA